MSLFLQSMIIPFFIGKLFLFFVKWLLDKIKKTQPDGQIRLGL